MMTTLINHIPKVVFHLLISDKFEIDWIKNGIFGVVIFSVFLRFQGKLFEIFITLTIRKYLTNQLLNNVQKFHGLIIQETDSS